MPMGISLASWSTRKIALPARATSPKEVRGAPIHFVDMGQSGVDEDRPLGAFDQSDQQQEGMARLGVALVVGVVARATWQVPLSRGRMV